MKRGACSVPKVFGFDAWFQKRFGHLCDDHDFSYVSGDVSKTTADRTFLCGMVARGWEYLPIAFLAWLLFLTWGNWLWNRRRIFKKGA